MSLLVFSLAFGSYGADESAMFRVGNRNHGWRGEKATETHSQFFLDKVQPVLSKRCVSCHGCYESPCQTNLQSYEGVRRGFNPEPIYGVKRWWSTKPSRMKDAKTPFEWRGKGFLPVVAHPGESASSDQPPKEKESVMYRLVDQASIHNTPSDSSTKRRGFEIEKLLSLQESIEKTSQFQCVANDDQYSEHFSHFSQNRWGVKPMSEFLQLNPLAGMPFGLPRLDPGSEQAILKAWMEQGSPGPSEEEKKLLESPSAPSLIKKWEDFFNEPSNQGKLSARYIYEHVFTAHLHFDENKGEFFELVRSRTQTGDIDEMVTDLPYSDPGSPTFYYRLKKVTEAIVQKKHIVWHLSDARLARLRELFGSSWGSSVPLPQYSSHNPFEYFSAIPAKIRSRFMIENSKIIIAAMVQGAVCVGNTATYAIRDHFWIWFLNPDSDISVTQPQLGLESWEAFGTAPTDYNWEPVTRVGKLLKKKIENSTLLSPERIREIVEHLGVGDIDGDAIALHLAKNGVPVKKILSALIHHRKTYEYHKQYQNAYELELRLALKEKGRSGLSLGDIWKGDGDRFYGRNNPNAWLSVTRHEKSSTVQFGEEGGKPQSIWVLSYSNFERLYYNLVAHFMSWGAIDHRLASWRIMSYVRLEAEDLAISFLPVSYRTAVRDEFTRGLARVKHGLYFPQMSTELMKIPGSGFLSRKLPPRPAETKNPGENAEEAIRWLVHMASQHLDEVRNDLPNNNLTTDQIEFEGSLKQLTGRSELKTGSKYAQYLPNISFIRVRGEGDSHWVYTLLANRGYKAHNFALGESLNRDPQYDTLSVYRGMVGAYPGVFFELSKQDSTKFISELVAIESEEGFHHFRSRYGISRNSVRFWRFFDWIHLRKSIALPENDPTEQGIIDLSQYQFFYEQ